MLFYLSTLTFIPILTCSLWLCLTNNGIFGGKANKPQSVIKSTLCFERTFLMDKWLMRCTCDISIEAYPLKGITVYLCFLVHKYRIPTIQVQNTIITIIMIPTNTPYSMSFSYSSAKIKQL